MRDLWRRLLDRVFGPLCDCHQRVYPRDLALHLSRNHSGDLS